MPYDLKEQRPDWDRIEELVADYDNVRVPCLIVWGARDETLPASMGYKLQAQLPDAWLWVVGESKHWLPLERPTFTANTIRAFVVTEGENWARVTEVEPQP